MNQNEYKELNQRANANAVTFVRKCSFPPASHKIKSPTMISSRSPNAIIIGAGPSGIALAYKLKHTLGFEDFTVYEKLDGPGGTWRTNTYPGW